MADEPTSPVKPSVARPGVKSPLPADESIIWKRPQDIEADRLARNYAAVDRGERLASHHSALYYSHPLD